MAKRKNIEHVKNIAMIRGFTLLSNIYSGSKSKYSWECKRKHQWMAKPNCIQQGRGCPECSQKK